MIDDLVNLIEKVALDNVKGTLASGKFGIEKESLRVSKSTISKKQHPQSLGSSLCHRYITTDFSEALLEFITPPFVDKKQGLNFLENIHHFVSCNLGDEIIWPFSMPPFIQLDDDIPIASYGASNLAKLKMTYRRGLSHRYGRIMQAIAGIHFNYSLPESIWNSSFFTQEQENSKQFKAKIYFRMLRNSHRMNWLILYLFGASPITTKNFLSAQDARFQKLDNHTYYLPHATSLRMSDLGYQNINQSNLEISTNSLQEYTFDLKQATERSCEDFKKIERNTLDDYPQINSNILQIEDEYYAISRPKSSIVSNQRLTTKLNESGVDYIELRSLDLNPFKRIGIDLDTVHFLEVFLIYCTLNSSPPIKNGELDEIKQNDLLVATRGREPGLELINNRTAISLKNWANQILDDMIFIAGFMNNETTNFTGVVEKFKDQITDPEQTLSAKFLDKILSEKLSFQELVKCLGENYKSQYINMGRSKNSEWSLLEKESADSIKRQVKLEQEDGKSFDKYLEEYFNQ